MGESFPGFREFVAARSRALSRTAYLLTGDPHSAEDLLQEALTRVASRWRRVVASGDPEAYVRRVLYTTHVSWWRRRRHGEPSNREVVVDQTESATARVVLTAALAQLTPKQRAVLVLRYYEDLPDSATASILGVSVSTVKSQTRYALARLRELAGVEIADLRGDESPTPADGVSKHPEAAR
jgi:RNA polymerase sigma-70 factor (sigma-E family)